MAKYKYAHENYDAKYDKLYLDILRLGRTHVKTGLSYNTLKDFLVYIGYDFECDCIELAVKQWFYDSFHHRGKDGKLISVDDLDKHLGCNFILSGDAALKLIDYETSTKNLWIAKYALWLSVALVIIQFITWLFSTPDKYPEVKQATIMVKPKDSIAPMHPSSSNGVLPSLHLPDTAVTVHHLDTLHKP